MDDKEFEGKLKRLDQFQSACTGCGLCVEGCATFQLSGWEHESPRGRIHLAAQFMNGRITPDSPALSTFDSCLGCHACESLCPHQVSYHKIRGLVQDLRSQLTRSLQPLMGKSEYKRWATLADRMGNHWWRRFGSKMLCIPFLQSGHGKSIVNKMMRPEKEESVLVFCCIQDLFQQEVIVQALNFMERLGHPLKVDRKQRCCGALFERLINGGEESVAYLKERDRAVLMQKKTTQAFLKWLPPKAYFLAKGCHSFISTEAPHAMDLYLLIEKILAEKKLKLKFAEPKKVFYQSYCRTESEGQDPVWRLLNQIEGLRVRPVPYPKACCGGYCGETLLHPQQAEVMAAQKLEALPPGSTLIVTSPDCWGLFHHYRSSAGEGLTILYPIQLFAQAEIISKNMSEFS